MAETTSPSRLTRDQEKDELFRLNSRLNEYITKRRELEALNMALSKERDLLKVKVEETESILVVTRSDLGKLQRKYDVDIKEKDKQLELLRVERDHFSLKFAESQEALRVSEVTANELRGERDGLKKRVADATAQLRIAETNITKLTQERDGFKLRIAELSDALRISEVSLGEARAEVEQGRIKFVDLQKLYRVAETTIEDLRVKLAELKTKYDVDTARLRDDYGKQIIILQRQITELTAERVRLEAELEKYRIKVAEYEASLETYVVRIRELEAQLRLAQEQGLPFKDQLATVQARLLRAEQERKAAQDELATLRLSYGHTERELSLQLEAVRTQLREQEVTLKSKFEIQLTAALGKLRDEYEQEALLYRDALMQGHERVSTASLKEAARLRIMVAHFQEDAKKMLAEARAGLEGLLAARGQLGALEGKLLMLQDSARSSVEYEFHGEVHVEPPVLDVDLEREIRMYRALLDGEESRIGVPRNEGSMLLEAGAASASRKRKSEEYYASASKRTTYEQASGLTCITTGPIHLEEVNGNGLYLVLSNTSSEAVDLSQWRIKSTPPSGEAASSTFAFLGHRVVLRPGDFVKVWAASAGAVASPPSSFVWSDLATLHVSRGSSLVVISPDGTVSSEVTLKIVDGSGRAELFDQTTGQCVVM